MITVRTEEKYHTTAELVRLSCRARTCTIHIYTTPGDGFPEFVVAGEGYQKDGVMPAVLLKAAEQSLDGHSEKRDAPIAVMIDGEPPNSDICVVPIHHSDSDERLGHLFLTGADDNTASQYQAARHIAASIVHDRALLRVYRDADHAHIRLREANHRMKNALQAVESLLSLQTATHGEGPARRVLQEATQRVRTIQLLYDRLSGRDGTDGGTLPLDLYLKTLLESVADVYRTAHPVTWHVEVESIPLPVDDLSSVGLIVNEVLSNALIHGFNDTCTGPSISVTAAREQSTLLLRIADNGIGIPSDFEPGESAGLGTTIVRLLTERLGGTLNYERCAGTAVSVRIPTAGLHQPSP